MGTSNRPSSSRLPFERVARIEAEVTRAAADHLNARDASTAMSHYASNATLVSNGVLYPTFAEAANDIKEFYRTLHKVHLCVWDETRVKVVSDDAAIFTATFRWSSTDTSGERINLQGVWTALYVRDEDRWRIQVRHESFGPMKD